MKSLKSIVFLAVILFSFGCEEEVVHYDFEKYKFVSFVDSEDSVGETYTVENESDYPVYLRYDGSVLEEGFTVGLTITAINAQEGTDYSISGNTVTFKAGEIKSEPFYITLIDNLLSSTEELSLEINIESVSNPAINIGVGIVNQSNTMFVLNILDNECSETIDIFENGALTNTTAYGVHTITGSIDGNTATLIGDLISYGPFPNATLEVLLTPVQEGATIGTATFDDFVGGTDNDGWLYQFRQIGEGTYDVCSGQIVVDFDVYYESGGAWAYWYTSNNVITLP